MIIIYLSSNCRSQSRAESPFLPVILRLRRIRNSESSPHSHNPQILKPVRFAQVIIHYPGNGPIMSQSVTIHGGRQGNDLMKRQIDNLGINGQVPKSTILCMDRAVLEHMDAGIPGRNDKSVLIVITQIVARIHQPRVPGQRCGNEMQFRWNAGGQL